MVKNHVPSPFPTVPLTDDACPQCGAEELYFCTTDDSTMMYWAESGWVAIEGDHDYDGPQWVECDECGSVYTCPDNLAL